MRFGLPIPVAIVLLVFAAGGGESTAAAAEPGDAQGRPLHIPEGQVDPAQGGAETVPELVAQPQKKPRMEQASAQYEQAIAELEAQFGPYDYRLSEQLYGLGLALQSLEEHAAAVDAFNRALHISRVNEGLHSLGQVPILDQLIASNKALHDWDSLDANYQALYWIQRRSFGERDPRLLPVIDRVGRWHLNAYNLDPEADGFGHLAAAAGLYQTAVAIIEQHFGEHDLRLVNALYGVSLSHLYLAAYLQRDIASERRAFVGRTSNLRSSEFERELARQQTVLSSFRDGKHALERIVEVYEHNAEGNAEPHAIALMHLGDWDLMFDRRQSAKESYARAYAIMQASGADPEDVTEYFARPRTLPALRMPEFEENEPIPEDAPYVLVKFDVSESGRARNIEIVESQPADDDQLRRRAKRSLAATRFRPSLENGTPVDATGVQLRYVFPD